MKSTKPLLRDLLAELAAIEEFTKGGRAIFMTHRMTQKAVIRSYEIIGEIVKRIPHEFRERNRHIDWRMLAGFEIISHIITMRSSSKMSGQPCRIYQS